MPGLEYEEKKQKLWETLGKYRGHNIIVAFSGGTDSSLLLKLVCKACGSDDVYAVTMQTRLHPMAEIESARETAREIGAKHIVIRTDELREAGILENPVDRCYRCKKYLFSKMKEKAEELCADILIEGTNEDDLHVYRPGIRAIQELGFQSPLAEAGLTKAEVRRLAAKYGLSVSEKPASPCLATRFPYGSRLDYRDLQKVAEGEEFLKKYGLDNVRLRIHGEIARIEVDEKNLSKVVENRREIVRYLKELGYSYITLDLEGFRSGSMDIGIDKSRYKEKEGKSHG